MIATVLIGMLAALTTLTAQGGRTDTLLVIDADGHPIPYANISIKGGTAQVANVNGLLLFRAGDDTLNMLVRRLGFASYQGKLGRANSNVAFHLTLTRNTQTLNKVVVNESMSAEPLRRNGFYDRMMQVKNGAPTGEFFTPEELSARPTTKISDFLYASRYAKIQQSTTSYRDAFAVLAPHPGPARRFIQGRAGCSMTLLLDGVVMHNMVGDAKDADGDAKKAFADDRLSIDDLVSGLDVMAIEVYPSTANAPTSIAAKVLGSACGIVAIWTGPR